MKQRFQAQVSVQFYPIEQEAALFVPKSPAVIEPLSTDALYPFQRQETA